jgi:hypothetical protein
LESNSKTSHKEHEEREEHKEKKKMVTEEDATHNRAWG